MWAIIKHPIHCQRSARNEDREKQGKQWKKCLNTHKMYWKILTYTVKIFPSQRQGENIERNREKPILPYRGTAVTTDSQQNKDSEEWDNIFKELKKSYIQQNCHLKNKMKQHAQKNRNTAEHQWLMPVILAAQKQRSGGSQLEANPRQIVPEILSQKYSVQNRAGRMA
jgi:hypothetical protein